MPPPNRLARPLTNSLAYSVPVPLEPGMMRPAPAAFSPRRELENLSIGLGRGAVTGMEGTKQLLTQPVATAQALIEAARQLGTDPAVILDMLRAARQKAMSGSLGLGELIGENVTPGMRGRRVPAMRELDVYHGTPHRFPATEANPLGEFDASKIGTGHGGQVYGEGIYYSESPDFAGFYAPLNKSSASSRASFIRLRDQAPQGSAEWKHYDNLAKEGFGSVYKADLPDEMIDRMLDYDKPINEQNQFVLDALEKAGINTQSAMRAGQMIHGQEAHLAKFGIPGITYREQGGPRNFVVFPGEEKKVRILERK